MISNYKDSFSLLFFLSLADLNSKKKKEKKKKSIKRHITRLFQMMNKGK